MGVMTLRRQSALCGCSSAVLHSKEQAENVTNWDQEGSFFIYILKAFESVATGQIQQCLTNHGDHPPEELDRHQIETVPCPCRPSTQSIIGLIFKLHKVGSLINVSVRIYKSMEFFNSSF